MKKILLIFSMIFCLAFTAEQKTNFHPKRLQKQIEKIWHLDDVKLTELFLNKETKDTLNIKGKIFNLESKSKGLIGYTYIGRVNCCRMGGCGAESKTPSVENFEYFDYFILFDAEAKIVGTRIFNYAASHGQQICSKGWLKQFNGFTGDKYLIVGKNIDAISGATISTNSITFDVQNKQQLIKNLINGTPSSP